MKKLTPNVAQGSSAATVRSAVFLWVNGSYPDLDIPRQL